MDQSTFNRSFLASMWDLGGCRSYRQIVDFGADRVQIWKLIPSSNFNSPPSGFSWVTSSVSNFLEPFAKVYDPLWKARKKIEKAGIWRVVALYIHTRIQPASRNHLCSKWSAPDPWFSPNRCHGARGQDPCLQDEEWPLNCIQSEPCASNVWSTSGKRRSQG